MRAVRFARFGEPSEVLTLEDLPAPQPGPGQVLLRIQARPINPSDLFAIRGSYGTLPELPATPGMECAGVVAALGEGVASVQVGQQVVPLALHGGAWQEYALADASGLVPVPPGLSLQQAAMVMVNPTSAWLLLHEEFKVAQGDWLIQNAANSAVGRFVIQLCRRAGVRTINVVRRRDVADELQAIGGDYVICEADEDVPERVREITGGKGARHALDSVAGASGERLLQSLAPGGTMVAFGAISRQPLQVDAGTLLFRGLTLRGWWLAYWYRSASPQRIAKLFGEVLPLIADGTLAVPVDAEYDLADVHQAIAAAEDSQRNGKILLVG